MSFNEEKRNAIKKYMLEKIRKDDENFIRKTAETFVISETSVRRYLKSCEEEPQQNKRGAQQQAPSCS